MTTTAYEVALDGGDGPTVVLAELRPSQVLVAAKMVGAEPSREVRLLKLGQIAARMSVLSVDGDASPAARETVLKKARWLNQLANAWGQIHSPTAADMAAVEGMSCSVGLDGERWGLKLPGPPDADGKPTSRLVVLAEVGPDTVAEAVREAELSAGSETAQGFLAQMTGPARSIRSIDGAAVSLADLRSGKGLDAWKGWDARFTVRETYVLGAAFTRIHGAAGVGEVTPVASNG